MASPLLSCGYRHKPLPARWHFLFLPVGLCVLNRNVPTLWIKHGLQPATFIAGFVPRLCAPDSSSRGFFHKVGMWAEGEDLRFFCKDRDRKKGGDVLEDHQNEERDKYVERELLEYHINGDCFLWIFFGLAGRCYFEVQRII